MIDFDKYKKVLKKYKIFEAFEKEKNLGFSDSDYKSLLSENVFIGILLYFYIISNTKGELAKEVSTKIKHIKLLRDCTRSSNKTPMNLRAAKVFVEAIMEFRYITTGKDGEETTDIKLSGTKLKNELIECYNGDVHNLVAKKLLLNDSDAVKAYLNTGD